ncbi:SUKH-4 immunity protein of toxin-antitoxin system [Streptomyces sp. 1114.5]|uniref:SUKH-4 family immunity protein n=1 Tax=Streptomyces sp. 1114.5 TaxID=1938830 RepID=UPI000F260A6C|nr:SUKH-4 family immunity protein [Streptomyces sp. 1114.5]RKT17243.1 SUKH-4 immunity protein of toxin-antitoxin system [Streptomyces sp. 1114.5]
MISRAQAVEAGHRWINGDLPQGAGAAVRRVVAHEFELGWVVWAEPPPVEVDPRTGERRAPEDVGAACAVVDRENGRFTVWPSAPVDEVVGLYRDFVGVGGYDPTVPAATGRGARAELTYRDGAGEQRSLALRSAAGLPHPALRGWWWLREQGVAAEDVLAVRTDLRMSALPGGYWAHALAAELPYARIDFGLPYGPRFDHRATAVRALPAPPDGPVRNRVPFPRPARSGPYEPDAVLAARLVERFGPAGVQRFDPVDVAQAELPGEDAALLLTVGVPTAVPGFFALHHPGPGAIADGSRPDAVLPPLAAHLAALGRGTRAAERERQALAGLLLLGTDGWALMALDTVEGTVRAVDPDYATARHCNAGLRAFVRCLEVFAGWWPTLRGLGPVAAGEAVDTLQRALAEVDGTVFADPENWWAVIVEQLWDGLL